MSERKKKPLKIIPLEKRLMFDASLVAIAGQVLWLDSADASTIIDADGDNADTGTGGANNGFDGFVSQWQDKSTSGFTVSASGTERPRYGIDSQNGQGVITFDGSNDRLISNNIIAGDDVTMFIVYNRTSSTGRDAVFELGGGASRNGIFLYANNTIEHYSNATFRALSSTYALNQYHLSSIIHDTTNVSAWMNSNNVLNTTTSGRMTTTGIAIGDDATSGDEMTGTVAEILVYDRDLTSDERHDVETYLAGKWGLTIANTAPMIVNNTGVTIDQGTLINLNNTQLASTDADNSNANLIYTVTDNVDNGILINTNTSLALGVGNSFLQSDIDNGYIRYTHDNSATVADSFSFTVSDNAATTSITNFNFSIVSSGLSGLNAIPNPVFHYNATDIDGDGDFSDQPADGSLISVIGTGIGTNQNATQSGVEQRPTYDIDAFDFGKGGIVLDGTDDHIDIPNNLLINDAGPWDEKSFAITFRTGVDVASDQIIYEQGGTTRGYNLGIWDGDLYAYVWNRAEWGVSDRDKAINLGAVSAETTYSVIIIHDATGVTLDDRTFSANVNGGVFQTVTRADVQYGHTGNVVVGRGDDTLNASDFSDFSNMGDFNGAIGELWSWNHALDSPQITEVENYMRDKWFGSIQTIDTNNTLSVFEGGSVTITSANLDTNDLESPDNAITYTLTSLPVNGILRLNSLALAINDTFTQDDIANNLITFDHDGTESGTDNFNFSVSDGFNVATPDTFNFSVANINDAPTLSDGMAPIAQGGTLTLNTTSIILGTDVDNQDSGLIYQIISNVNDGTLFLNGNILSLNDTFTHQNVSDGLVTYTHNNIGTTDDTFNINVSDGTLTSATRTITMTMQLSATNISNITTNEGGDTAIDNNNLQYTQPTTGWYDNNWDYRQEIIVDSAQIDSDLTDFALLITGANMNANFWTNVQNDGGDIVVTNAAGNKLDRELVTIDTIAQTLQIYIRTDLSSTVDTTLYFYYGNTAANEANNATTWDSRYTGVWHFEDDFNDGDVADSSQYNNDAFTDGGFNNGNLATGIVGGAGQFNNGEYLALNYAYNGNNSLPQISVSAWINTTDNSGGLSDNWAILDFDRSEFFNVYIRNGQIGFSTSDNGSIDDQFASSGLNDGNWHHITAVYDGIDKILYANGVEVDRLTNVHAGNNLGRGTRFGFIGDGSEATSFNAGRNNVYYDGFLDNIRLYEGTLSGAWVAAEYRNQNDPSTFYSGGGQIIRPNTTHYTLTDNTNNGTLYIDANMNGILDSGEAIGMSSTFTQGDINANRLRYVHDGGETTTDDFSFTVTNNFVTTAERTINIDVTPINDIPTDIGLNGTQILDTNPIGTIIGTLSTIDVDLPGDTFTYSIQSDPDGKFVIIGNQLRLNNAVNFGISDTHDVTIRTDDGNGGIFDRSFTINVVGSLSGINILPETAQFNPKSTAISISHLNTISDEIIRNMIVNKNAFAMSEASQNLFIYKFVSAEAQFNIGKSKEGKFLISENSVQIETDSLVKQPENSNSHYTKMLDFLKSMQEFHEGDKQVMVEQLTNHNSDESNNFNIHQQFDDIRIYNENRAKNLLKALS